MGCSLSINRHKRPSESSHAPRKIPETSSSSFRDDKPQLIPGLPDVISLQILARIPKIHYWNLKAVSRIWKSAVTNPEIYKIRTELGTTEEWLYILTNQGKRGDVLLWHALDPVSKTWLKLPPIPNARVREHGLLSRKWNIIRSHIRESHGRNSDRTLLCGCSISAVDGCLYMLGGFSTVSCLNLVWKYDPISNSWSEANPMCVGRALCNTGVLNNKLFVVGGITIGHDDGVLTPIQSAEVFDPQTGLWSELPSMSFSNAKALSAAFFTNSPKPMATGVACYKGKLYVPQSLYHSTGFLNVGGEVYDPETNSWADMPRGMGEGWPIKNEDTNRSVIVDGDLYTLRYSTPEKQIKIKVYKNCDASWSEGSVSTRDIPESYSLCLLAGLVGKLHVIAKDVNGNIAVIRGDKRDYSIASSSEGTSESFMWNVIASRNFGSAMPVSCQNLNV